MGLTGEVLDQIKARSREDGNTGTVTALYQDITTMKAYGMAPGQWRRLSPIDRKILFYTRIMENHYESLPIDKIKRERKMEAAGQQLMTKMPRLAPGRR